MGGLVVGKVYAYRRSPYQKHVEGLVWRECICHHDGAFLLVYGSVLHREDASAERVRFGDLRVLRVREKGKLSYLVNDLAGQKARSALAQSLECFNYHQRRIPGGYTNRIS